MKHTNSLFEPRRPAVTPLGLQQALTLCALLRALKPALMLASLLLWLLPAAANANDQKPPTVLATIKPLHGLASAVTRGVSTPSLLIGSNTSPHLFQLKPSHIRAVSNADVVVWAGEGVERFLPAMIEKFNPRADVLEIAATDGITLHPSRNKHSDHVDPEPHGKDIHGEGDIDYHLWLDPDNAKKIVEVLALRLATLDPSNAEKYRSNAASFGTQLDATVIDIEKLFSEVKGVRYLVYHDSLQYLEKAFGLGEAMVVAPQPQVQAGGRRVRALHSEVAESNIGCLMSEPQFRSPVVKILADDLGVQPVTVDPLAFDFVEGADLYNEWLLHTATVIADCLASVR